MSNHCGNPLYRDWMKEWMDDAHQMKTKSYFTYKKAYDSLCKCPVTFSHPSESTQLIGIGENLAKRLEERMIKHCQENGIPIPTRSRQGSRRSRRAMEDIEDENEGNTRVRKKTMRTYVPSKRSGGYAILLCLLDFHDQGLQNINQNQICREGQKYADHSFSRAEAGSNYTAFSSMKTLIKHGYVWKNGSPARYSLTETGISMAEHTRNVENGVVGARPPRLNNNSNDDDDDNVSDNDDSNNNNMDDDLFGLDLSLYVMDPSKHTSISLNNRTRTYEPSGSGSSSQNITTTSSSNNNNNSSRNNGNNGSSGRNRNSGRSNGGSRRSTQSTVDPINDIFNPDNIDDQLSLYVRDTSKHSSISVGGSSRVYTRSETSNSTNRSTTNPIRDIFNPDNIDDQLSLYVRDPSKHSSISVGGSSKVYTRPETSNSTNRNTTHSSNHANTLSSSLPFDLTDEELAYDLSLTETARENSVESDVIEILSPPPSTTTTTVTSAKTSTPFDNPNQSTTLQRLRSPSIEDDLDFFPLSQARSQTIKENTFHYTYVDPDGTHVSHFTQAAIAIDQTEKCLMYRLRFYTSQRQHDKAPSMRDVEVDPEDREYAFAYVREVDIIDAVCPGLPAKPILQLHGHDNDTTTFWPLDDSQSRLDVVKNKKKQQQNKSSQPTASQTLSIPSSPIDSSQNMFPPATLSSQPISSSQTSSVASSQPVPVSQLISESSPTLTYSPGEYEILLVLDCREIQMQKDRQYFQRMLKIKGVNVTTRSLDLGDVIWVARKKGHDRPADELFLDFVVERKRLDDLVTSIKDGRFREQKGRLKRSGSRKIIYIVEEYDRESANQFGQQAIQTAMSSTQVIDGFFLKRTNNPEETIDYLVMLTKMMEELYRDTTVHAIPEHIITRQNYLTLKEAYAAQRDAYLVTYPLYCELNKKAGSTTVHDIFMRMLMTIRGINAEKALALMKIYPTPYSLLQAFSNKSPEQAKMLARDATKDQIARRKWTTTLSERLYQIWGVSVYPEEEEDSGIEA